MKRRVLFAVLALVAAVGVAAGAWLWLGRSGSRARGPEAGASAGRGTAVSGSAAANGSAAARHLVATAHYRCDGGRTIDADFYRGTPAGGARPGAAPEPGAPPRPDGSVRVDLSDGRSATLHQTISADGARYSDGDPSVEGSEALVFWAKGNGALVLEHGLQKRYTGCVRVADDPGGLPNVYASGSRGFSIRYPAGWTVDTTYRYTALGPGRAIAGVSFTVPDSLAAGTNLSADSYLSVEELPRADRCTASPFLGQGARVQVDTVAGTEYSVARRTDAGAGNRYGETVWAIPGTNPCIGVRAFVHWTVLENYPPGAVRAFDEKGLTDTFDAMRGTLVVAR